MSPASTTSVCLKPLSDISRVNSQHNTPDQEGPGCFFAVRPMPAQLWVTAQGNETQCHCEAPKGGCGNLPVPCIASSSRGGFSTLPEGNDSCAVTIIRARQRNSVSLRSPAGAVAISRYLVSLPPAVREACMPFSCFGKKRPKRSRFKGDFLPAVPLENSPPLTEGPRTFTRKAKMYPIFAHPSSKHRSCTGELVGAALVGGWCGRTGRLPRAQAPSQ